MKYIVFLTENVQCNRVYIGVHATQDPDVFDGYLGDSVYVNQANTFKYPKTPLQEDIKKYGIKSFKRITLYIYDNFVDAYKKENMLVDGSFTTLIHTYNTNIADELRFRITPLYQFNQEGKLLKKWRIPVEASDFYNYSITRFKNACITKSYFLDSYWSTKSKIDITEYNIPKSLNCITYLYSLEGKLLKEYWNIQTMLQDINSDLSINDIQEAIKKNKVICDKYYVANYMTALYIPSPRKQYYHETFYVYSDDNTYIGQYRGKEVMKVINLHSWLKISKIIETGWYKKFFISLTPVETVPERIHHSITIYVYNKYGEFIEQFDSIKAVKEKYNIPTARMNKIIRGDKYFGDYIFKYSK